MTEGALQDLALEGEVRQGDKRYEGGRFQQIDQQVTERWKHGEDCLGQHDVPHALTRGHVHRSSCLPLPAWNLHDSATNDLSTICSIAEA